MEEEAFTVIFLEDESLVEDEIDTVPVVDPVPGDEGEDEPFQVVEVPFALIPQHAEFYTVRVKIQEVLVENGIATIDRSFGEYVVLRLRSNLTNLTILNWAPNPYFSRVILDVFNEGNFSIIWPEWIKWARNKIPEVTDSGNDTYILTNIPNVTVKGSVVGTGYPVS